MAKFLPLLLCCVYCLSGCCRDEYQFSGDTQVLLHEINGGPVEANSVADTVRARFFFRATGVYLYALATPDFRPSQLLMAMTCGEVYDREVEKSSVRVYLDRGIRVNETAVAAGQDLVPLFQSLALELSGVTFLETGVDCMFGDSFLEIADIPPGDYTFTFEADLEDGTPITASASVYLDLP